MGIFTREPAEDVRGLPDEHLPKETNEELMMLALAVLMRGVGIDDEPLIEEMERRVGVVRKE